MIVQRHISNYQSVLIYLQFSISVYTMCFILLANNRTSGQRRGLAIHVSLQTKLLLIQIVVLLLTVFVYRLK